MWTSEGSSGSPSLGAHVIEGESLPGFLVRLAGWLGFDRADRLAGTLGLRQPGSAVAPADLERLARFARTGPAMLSQASYRPSHRAPFHHFGDGVLPREFILLDRRRACPLCLCVSPHHRMAWDLALLTACPVHAVRLRERCEACSRPMGWSGNSLMSCMCGADVRSMGCDRVGEAERSANSRLLDLVMGKEVPWLGRELVRCGRDDMPWLVMCLGMFVTGWTRQRRIEPLVAAGPDAIARVLAAGMDALSDWPASLHGHLHQEAGGQASRPGSHGVRKAMGRFYDWLTGMAPGPVKDALAAAVGSFVEQDPVLAGRSHRSRLVGVREKRSTLSLKEAASMLGTSGAGVRRLMALGAVPAMPTAGRGVPMLIAREAVQVLVAAPTMDMEEVAAALGVSRRRVRVLVDGGLLPRRGVNPSRKSGCPFRANDVQALLARLEALAPGHPASGRTVGFEHAAESLRRRGVDFVGLIRLILEGGLSIVGHEDGLVGLKRLRFLARQVTDLGREAKRASHLTIEETAGRMSMKWQVVSNLVSRGLLPSVGRKVHPDDVARFLADHVTGGELARQAGTSPRALAARLGKGGIAPVVGPLVDGSRMNIYRRDAGLTAAL